MTLSYVALPPVLLQRVEADGDWNLFCPNEAPGLSDTHSDEFKVIAANNPDLLYSRDCTSAPRTLLSFNRYCRAKQRSVKAILHKQSRILAQGTVLRVFREK